MPLKTVPIHQWVQAGDIQGISRELACGVHVDIRDPQTRRTPLTAAAASIRTGVPALKLLIDVGADGTGT